MFGYSAISAAEFYSKVSGGRGNWKLFFIAPLLLKSMKQEADKQQAPVLCLLIKSAQR